MSNSELASSPPHYDALRSILDVASVNDLPAYTARRPRTAPNRRQQSATTEHLFFLHKSGKKKPWATLSIFSNASSPKHLPTFVQGELIHGTLFLSLDQPDPIQSITITIVGQIITGLDASETTEFLEHPTVLWASPGSSESSKLNGQHHWPFSITLPQSVSISDELFSLPQSIKEINLRPTVVYSVSVNFVRGKFRFNDKLVTTIAYVPGTRPGPPSELRQLAYAHNTPSPGPKEDSLGWEALPQVTLNGCLFGRESVQIRCRLFLAKPLCYTRGTSIPCFIRLECENTQALDIITSSDAIHTLLRRRAQYNNTKTRYESDDIVTGTWTPEQGSGPSDTKELFGEIALPKSLPPTTHIAHLSIRYSVVLVPSKVAGFVPSSLDPLTEVPIEIATKMAKGSWGRHLVQSNGVGEPNGGPSRRTGAMAQLDRARHALFFIGVW